MTYILNVVCNVLELESVEVYFYTPGFIVWAVIYAFAW